MHDMAIGRWQMNRNASHPEPPCFIRIIPSEQPSTALSAEAESLGINVVHVEEGQLLLIIDDARKGFKEHFGGGAAR